MIREQSGQQELQTDYDEVAVWEGRKYLYGLFGTVFAQPLTVEWLQEIGSDKFRSFLNGLGLSSRVYHWLDKLATKIDQPKNAQIKWVGETNIEYDRLFMVPIKGTLVTLGASQYLDKTLLDQRRIMLEDLYQRFGFVWREFLRDTPGVWPNEPEHMVLVFPMLSILADEVVVSLREKDEYSEPLMKIFQDLLLMTKDWIPVCLRRIGEATENPFYQLFSVLILESLEREYELFQNA